MPDRSLTWSNKRDFRVPTQAAWFQRLQNLFGILWCIDVDQEFRLSLITQHHFCELLPRVSRACQVCRTRKWQSELAPTMEQVDPRGVKARLRNRHLHPILWEIRTLDRFRPAASVNTILHQLKRRKRLPKKKGPMAKVIPFGAARARFETIIRRTKEDGDRYIVDSRGEPQAVILSLEDYLTNVLKQPRSLAALQRAAKRRGLNTLSTADIDREVRRIRKASAREN